MAPRPAVRGTLICPVCGEVLPVQVQFVVASSAVLPVHPKVSRPDIWNSNSLSGCDRCHTQLALIWRHLTPPTLASIVKSRTSQTSTTSTNSVTPPITQQAKPTLPSESAPPALDHPNVLHVEQSTGGNTQEEKVKLLKICNEMFSEIPTSVNNNDKEPIAKLRGDIHPVVLPPIHPTQSYLSATSHLAQGNGEDEDHP